MKFEICAKADFYAAASAASAVCIDDVVIGWRFAYKYMVKYIQQKQQQKQQRQQHKNLLWQFIQLSIPMSKDAKGLSIPPTP